MSGPAKWFDAMTVAERQVLLAQEERARLRNRFPTSAAEPALAPSEDLPEGTAFGVDLEAELMRAIRTARLPRVAPMLGTLGLSRRVQWGLAMVACYGLDRELYEPERDGRFAVIAPVVEGGDLIDLAAIELASQHAGTRLGFGRGLGLDAVPKARARCCDLVLMERPLDWLRDPVDSVYLFKLADARVALEGVDSVTCSSLVLAERLHAILPPSRHDRVMVRA